MKNTLIFLFTIIGLTVTLGAEKTYRLENLIDMLKEQNLLLKIHEIENSLAIQFYNINRSLPDPQLELSRGQGETLESADSRLIWGIEFKLEVPNPVFRHYYLKAEKQSISKTRLMTEIHNLSIVREFKTHFYRYQYFKSLHSLLGEKQKVLTEITRITKLKVSIGEARGIDYLRSSVELQKNTTNRFKNRKRFSYEKTRLNEFLNNSLSVDSKFANDFNFSPLPDIESTIDRIRNNNPFIGFKRLDLEQKNFQIKSSQFSLIESLELFASKAREVDANVWKFGVGIKVPVFGTKHFFIKKAKLEREKVRLELEYLRQHLSADINRMVTEIRILEKEIDTFKGAILIEGRENLDLSKKLYLAGEVPLMVFLDSQNSYFEIKKRYFEVITEWKILKSELEELLGVEL